MPRIRHEKMIECLLSIHTKLQAIWLECRNDSLCEELKEQMDYIESIIKVIEDAFP
jgi:hypothetical protein